MIGRRFRLKDVKTHVYELNKFQIYNIHMNLRLTSEVRCITPFGLLPRQAFFIPKNLV
jgi:hypothetical protein